MVLVVVYLHCCSVHTWLERIKSIGQVGECERHAAKMLYLVGVEELV